MNGSENKEGKTLDAVVIAKTGLDKMINDAQMRGFVAGRAQGGGRTHVFPEPVHPKNAAELKKCVSQWNDGFPLEWISLDQMEPGQSFAGLFCNSGRTDWRGIERWDMSRVTDTSSMFKGCSGLSGLYLQNWNVSGISCTDSMFEDSDFNGNLHLKTWPALESAVSMFKNDRCLTGKGIAEWHCPKLTDCQSMFSGCTALSSPLDDWTLDSVSDVSRMFAGCTAWCGGLPAVGMECNLKAEACFLNCRSFNPPVQDRSYSFLSHIREAPFCFAGCTMLNGIQLIAAKLHDLTNTYCMCKGCVSLRGDYSMLRIPDEPQKNKGMFSECPLLKYSDLPKAFVKEIKAARARGGKALIKKMVNGVRMATGRLPI